MKSDNPTPTNPPAPVPSPFELRATARSLRAMGRVIGEACSSYRFYDVSAIACERWAAQLESAVPPKPLSNAKDAAVEQWQQIETAPTKGVIILTDGKKVSPGGWTDMGEGEANGWWNVDGDDWEPTHWMPLPTPPESAATARAGRAKEGEAK